MASREYFIGKYEEYYNSLSGEASASGKASEFVTEVSNLVTEFNNVSQIMIYWSGEAKDAMSSQSITAILEKFKTTQENLQEALLPCCEAIDSLSQNLSNMKTTEDSWLQLKNDLERKMNSKPRERIEEGGVTKDNPKYKTWKKEVDSLEQQISALKSNLDQIKQLCDADIEKIETLEQSLQEFTDYMTLTNSIMGINSEFSSYTLEQRLQYLQELIDNYQEIYNSLNTLYEQKYGKGFQFTGEDFKKLDFLFDAFDIYWMSKVDRNTLIVSNTREPILLNIEKLTQIISYCNMNDVFGKINSYMNGASWKDSGLESLYDNGQFYDTNSANFMNFNIYNEDRFKQRLRDKYGVKGDVREYLKQNYDSVVSSYQNLMTSYGEYQKLTSAMAEVKSKIDNIKEAKKLMPYEILMENGDFKSYLTADYSYYNLLNQEQLAVLSQQEVALYDYLYRTRSKAEADAYLKAMENTMNQRIGAYRAAEYIEYIKDSGYGFNDLLASGWEGTKDGVRNFFDGIADCFRVASTEAGTKSALDYEMMYKTQFMQQLMSDPSYINQDEVNGFLGAVNLNTWYNTGTSIGNMVVPSLVSFIPVVGKPMSSALMTMSITGNTAVEAKQEGYSTSQAYLYGAVSGLSETATEILLGGIPGISNLEGKGLFAGMLSEGFEEFTQEYLDVGVRWAILGEKPEFTLASMHDTFSRASQAGIQGAMTSGIMQGGNAGLGVVANSTTRALSPTITHADGSVSKAYNSFGEFKNTMESNFYTPKAETAISDAIAKVGNGENISFADKIKLNRAISNVSAQELSGITKNLTTDQKASLKSATSGIVKMSSDTSAKLDTADTFAQVESATDSLSSVNNLSKDALNSEVTRDGRTLAEYIADTKTETLDNNTMEMIKSEDPKIAKEMTKRIEKRQKAQFKAFKKQFMDQKQEDATRTPVKTTVQQDTQNASATATTQQGATDVQVKTAVQQNSQNTSATATSQRGATDVQVKTAVQQDSQNTSASATSQKGATDVQVKTAIEQEVPKAPVTAAIEQEAPKTPASASIQQEAPKAPVTAAIQKGSPKAPVSAAIQQEAPKAPVSAAIQQEAPVTAAIEQEAPKTPASASIQQEAPKVPVTAAIQQEVTKTPVTTSSQLSDVVIPAANSAILEYVVSHNSNAGKKGTKINVDMSKIDRSLTPAGNYAAATSAWNAAGRPSSGETYSRLQSGYAYSKLAGGSNRAAVSQLHQQDGNINYKTSMFRSNATTEQGMSNATFSEMVSKNASVEQQNGIKVQENVEQQNGIKPKNDVKVDMSTDAAELYRSSFEKWRASNMPNEGAVYDEYIAARDLYYETMDIEDTEMANRYHPDRIGTENGMVYDENGMVERSTAKSSDIVEGDTAWDREVSSILGKRDKGKTKNNVKAAKQNSDAKTVENLKQDIKTENTLEQKEKGKQIKSVEQQKDIKSTTDTKAAENLDQNIKVEETLEQKETGKQTESTEQQDGIKVQENVEQQNGIKPNNDVKVDMSTDAAELYRSSFEKWNASNRPTEGAVYDEYIAARDLYYETMDIKDTEMANRYHPDRIGTENGMVYDENGMVERSAAKSSDIVEGDTAWDREVSSILGKRDKGKTKNNVKAAKQNSDAKTLENLKQDIKTENTLEQKETGKQIKSVEQQKDIKSTTDTKAAENLDQNIKVEETLEQKETGKQTESTEQQDDFGEVVIPAADPTILEYVIPYNSNAGKKGTKINVDMSLIDRTLTPDGNYSVALSAWNAAGRPSSGEIYSRLQSAYAYSKLAGDSNKAAISQLHQQDGNINYKTSIFRSNATTEQGMSNATFSELVEKSNSQVSSEVAKKNLSTTEMVDSLLEAKTVDDTVKQYINRLDQESKKKIISSKSDAVSRAVLDSMAVNEKVTLDTITETALENIKSTGYVLDVNRPLTSDEIMLLSYSQIKVDNGSGIPTDSYSYASTQMMLRLNDMETVDETVEQYISRMDYISKEALLSKKSDVVSRAVLDSMIVKNELVLNHDFNQNTIDNLPNNCKLIINKPLSAYELTILSDVKNVSDRGIEIKVGTEFENARVAALEEMTKRLMDTKEVDNIAKLYISHLDQKSKETIISSKSDAVSRAVLGSMAVNEKVTLDTITETALDNIKSTGYVLDVNRPLTSDEIMLLSYSQIKVDNGSGIPTDSYSYASTQMMLRLNDMETIDETVEQYISRMDYTSKEALLSKKSDVVSRAVLDSMIVENELVLNHDFNQNTIDNLPNNCKLIINKPLSAYELTILSDVKNVSDRGIEIKVGTEFENARVAALEEMTKRLMDTKEVDNIAKLYISHLDQKSKETIISSKSDAVSRAVLGSMAVNEKVTLDTITETALDNIKSTGYVLDVNRPLTSDEILLLSESDVKVREYTDTIPAKTYAIGEITSSLLNTSVVDETVEQYISKLDQESKELIIGLKSDDVSRAVLDSMVVDGKVTLNVIAKYTLENMKKADYVLEVNRPLTNSELELIRQNGIKIEDNKQNGNINSYSSDEMTSSLLNTTLVDETVKQYISKLDQKSKELIVASKVDDVSKEVLKSMAVDGKVTLNTITENALQNIGTEYVLDVSRPLTSDEIMLLSYSQIKVDNGSGIPTDSYSYASTQMMLRLNDMETIDETVEQYISRMDYTSKEALLSKKSDVVSRAVLDSMIVENELVLNHDFNQNTIDNLPDNCKLIINKPLSAYELTILSDVKNVSDRGIEIKVGTEFENARVAALEEMTKRLMDTKEVDNIAKLYISHLDQKSKETIISSKSDDVSKEVLKSMQSDGRIKLDTITENALENIKSTGYVLDVNRPLTSDEIMLLSYSQIKVDNGSGIPTDSYSYASTQMMLRLNDMETMDETVEQYISRMDYTSKEALLSKKSDVVSRAVLDSMIVENELVLNHDFNQNTIDNLPDNCKLIINKPLSAYELTILSDVKNVSDRGIEIKVGTEFENARVAALEEMTKRLMDTKEVDNIAKLYISHLDQKSKETIISSKSDAVSRAVLGSMAVNEKVTLDTITENALENIKSTGYVLDVNRPLTSDEILLLSKSDIKVDVNSNPNADPISAREYAIGEMIKSKVIDEVVINNYLEGKPNLLEVDERIINFVSNEISINSSAYSSDVIEYVSNAVATRFGNIRENYFSKVASSLKDIGYGVDQGILHNLMTFESDGKRYSYRQAVDLVNQAEAQGKPIPKFIKRCTQEYFDVKNYLMNNYKFSKEDASVAILAIDSNVGACTYASFANEIFASFIGKEAAFENAFGFPMYITVNGVRRFNASQLMADIYVSINSSKYGGRLFNVDAFGNYTINPYVISAQKDLSGRKKIDANFQNYLSGRDASRVKLCSKYLESKGVKYESVNYKYYSGLGSNATLAKFKLDIAKGIRDGKHYSISIHGSKDGFIRLIDPLTGNARVFKGNGGHSMYITGMTNGGFVVSSWGKQYVIPFTDLINGNFNLNSSTFKGSIYENSQFNSNNNTNNNNHLHNNVINFVNNLLNNNNNNNGLNPNLTTEEIVERLKSKKFVTPDVISSIGKLDQRSKELILDSKVDNVSKAVLDSMAINGKVKLNAITENTLKNISKYGYTLEVSGYLTDSELKVLSDVDIPVNVNGKVKSSREYTLTETLKKNIVNPTIVKNFLKGNHYGLLYDRDVVSSITREIANNRSLYDSESIRIAAEASVNMFGNERSNFFENFSEYGVDQGALYKLMELDLNGVNYTYSQAQKLINEARQNGRVLPFFQKRCTPEYFDVKEFIMNKYHFSKQDASLVLTAIDNKGACTYASFANEILSHFKGKEKQFEEKFGFPMYTTLPNGVRKLNSSYLMADLYAFINSSENGGVLFNLTYDGRHVVNSNVIGETIDPLRRKLPDSSKQKYLTRHEDGRNKDSIKRYLASKGLNYSSSSVWSQSEIKTMDDVEYFKTKILNDMMNGYQYEISIWASDDQIRMISTDADRPNCFFSNKRGNMKNTRYSTGAHSIYITGVDGDNLIVSSWGHKYKIPFVDLIKGQYVIDRSIIS